MNFVCSLCVIITIIIHQSFYMKTCILIICLYESIPLRFWSLEWKFICSFFSFIFFLLSFYELPKISFIHCICSIWNAQVNAYYKYQITKRIYCWRCSFFSFPSICHLFLSTFCWKRWQYHYKITAHFHRHYRTTYLFCICGIRMKQNKSLTNKRELEIRMHKSKFKVGNGKA